MGDPITLYSRTTGLNVVDDLSQLQLDPKSGASELGTASNFDVSDSGIPKKRSGLVKISSGNTTVICSTGKLCLAQVDQTLVFVDASKKQTTILSDVVGRVAMTKLDGRIYFCTKTDQRGFVESDGVVQPWEFISTFDGDNVELSGPPSGISHINYHLGVMYAAVGEVVYESRPYQPNVFALSEAYTDFGAEVLEMFSSTTTRYVVSAEGLYAHFGTGTNTEQKKLLGAGEVILGTFAEVFSFKQPGNNGVLVTTKDGVKFLSGGSVDSVGKGKLNNVDGSVGSAYVNNTHYYCAIK